VTVVEATVVLLFEDDLSLEGKGVNCKLFITFTEELFERVGID
jgi:hypothetical protein